MSRRLRFTLWESMAASAMTRWSEAEADGSAAFSSASAISRDARLVHFQDTCAEREPAAKSTQAVPVSGGGGGQEFR